MIGGPVFTADFHRDCDQIDEILERDFGDRFRNKPDKPRPSRPILSPKRSLGSVIKLFTPSAEFTDEYNAWLADYAGRNGLIFVDAYTLLLSPSDPFALNPDFAADTLHTNEAGARALADAVDARIIESRL